MNEMCEDSLSTYFSQHTHYTSIERAFAHNCKLVVYTHDMKTRDLLREVEEANGVETESQRLTL